MSSNESEKDKTPASESSRDDRNEPIAPRPEQAGDSRGFGRTSEHTIGGDDLPDLSDPYPISDQQVEQYWTEGFIVLEAVLTPEEVVAYGAGIRRDAMKHFEANNMETEFGGSLLQKLNLRFECEAMRCYCLSPRIGSIGGRLTRSTVRIYHEQALFKPPGGNASYWHQDQYFWPLETTRSLGTWMPLVDVSEEMGALRYVRTSHHLRDLGQHSIEAESQTFFDGVIAQQGLEVHQIESMKAGDMCVHNGWTIHGAPANRSNQMREAVVVTMYPDGTRVAPLLNDYRKSDAVQFLGGREVGQIADSDLNTILFSSD